MKITSSENINYIVGIRQNSVNGDSIHVKGIQKYSNFNVLYTRNPLTIYRLISSKDKTIIREHPLLSIYLLFMNTTNVFVEINGSIYDEWRKNVLRFFSLQVQKYLLNKTAGNLFVSQGLLNRFVDLGIVSINRNFVVPNAGDYGVSNLSTKIIKNSLGYVGAITEWQDLDRLLRQLSCLETKFTLFIISKDISKLNTYKNIDIIDMGNSNSTKVNYLYNVCEYVLIPDNRVYKNYFLSSSIKLHQAVFLKKKVITLKHSESLIMQEFNLSVCFCPQCFKNDINGHLKYRSWSNVSKEIEKIVL